MPESHAMPFAEPRRARPLSALSLTLTLALTAGVAQPVQAGCLQGFMTRLSDYEAGNMTPRRAFQVNEYIVLCFRANASGYVAVHDSPIQGDYEQLYPNRLTHPGGQTNAEIVAGEMYCFGGRDTFPLYHPANEGVGLGKVSIALTRRQEDQLATDDFAIPGQRVAEGVMNLHLSDHRSGSEICGAREVLYIEYQITD